MPASALLLRRFAAPPYVGGSRGARPFLWLQSPDLRPFSSYAPFDGYVSHWAEAWDSKKSDWVQTEQPISPWHAKDRLLDFRDSYSRWRGQPCFREMAEYDRKVSDCYPRWEAEGPMIGRLKQHGEWQLTVDPCGGGKARLL